MSKKKSLYICKPYYSNERKDNSFSLRRLHVIFICHLLRGIGKTTSILIVYENSIIFYKRFLEVWYINETK